MKRVAPGFSGRIRKLVSAAGSQRKLADLIGFTDVTIGGWLAGSQPYQKTLDEICRRTRLPIEWLRDGRGEEDEIVSAFAEGIQARFQEETSVSPREKLRRARERAGLDYRALGRRIGRDGAYLRSLEEGRAPLSETTADLLVAELPGLVKEELMSGSDSPPVISISGAEGTYGMKPSIALPPGMKGRFVPLLSMAQAGAFDANHTDEYYAHEGVFAPNVDDRKAFAVRVSGNSMEPDIMEGDVVVCAPGSQLHNGDCAVVRTHSDQAFIKFWRKVGDSVTLESANPGYSPLIFPLAEIAGAWPVIQIIASRRIRRP